MQDRRKSPDRAPARADDALVTGRLVLELIHAANATRRSETAGGSEGPGHADTNVSPHAVRASIHLYQHGPLRISDIARGLGVSLGWASRLVDELESAGLVRRSRDPDDRRATWIELTPESLARVETDYRWRGDAVEHAIAPFDAGERAAIAAFLRRLTDELAPAGHPAPQQPREPVLPADGSPGTTRTPS